MHGTIPIWRRLRARILCGLAFPVLVTCGATAHADERIKSLPDPDEKAPPRAVVTKSASFNLEACRQLALEKAPAVAAARAILGAAEARARAVHNLRCISLISRDIPIRRKQACLGINIGQAAVTQAEWDTIHGVTYCYLSYIYAYKQNQVAEKALDNIKKLHEGANLARQSNNVKVDQPLVDRIGVYIRLAEGRSHEARQGMLRAKSALIEAIGLDEDHPFELEIGEPGWQKPPSIDEVRALALARRGEMTQVSDAARVSCLEIEAQRRKFSLKENTFAAASDIHAREVPQSFHDETYRPGALGLEMPVLLPGKRKDPKSGPA